MSHDEYHFAEHYYEQHRTNKSVPFHWLTDFARFAWLIAAKGENPVLREVRR